jgi:hypothetical protein
LSRCSFPTFSITISLPNLLALIPIPDLAISLPFTFPPHCPLD